MKRRNFLSSLALSPWAALAGQAPEPGSPVAGTAPPWESPLFHLREKVKAPIKIASIELLRSGKNFFLRTRSTDGLTSTILTKQMEDYVPILRNRIVPFFLGKDARDLERLIDEVYVFNSNYKLAGQPFWAPVAYVEQSLFDLLGRSIGKPVGELLGGVLREEIPIYLSGSVRDTTAEREVEVYVRAAALTGAEAVKFKIGGRMSRNADVYAGRTETMLELARKRLGDRMILYADANGSYNAAKAIQIGRLLEQLDYQFFEEPCPWEEVSETQAVADALSIPIAFGEQDSSLWKLHWMIRTRALDIVQPDLNYCGGFTRAARIARMAREAGLPIVPHNTQTGAASVYILQFASAIPNVGPYMEYPWRTPPQPESWYAPHFEVRNGKIAVPKGPGLGLEIDPAFLARLEPVFS